MLCGCHVVSCKVDAAKLEFADLNNMIRSKILYIHIICNVIEYFMSKQKTA